MMKVGETYINVDEPLGPEFEVLKVKGNYAYLGHFTGDQCKMKAFYMSDTFNNNIWYKTRIEALEKHIELKQMDVDLLWDFLDQYTSQKGLGK